MKQKKISKEKIKSQTPLTLMILPAVILIIVFGFLPRYGIVLAFKDYNYRDGITGSPWAGLENFKYVFSDTAILRVVKNTFLYHIANTVALHVCAVALAVLLYMVSKKASKFFQKITSMTYLVSFSAMTAVVYLFLRYDGGLVNNILEAMGREPISFYTETTIWPFLLVFVNTWWGAGIKAIYYYSIFMNVDSSLFEAIEMDGGSWRHKIFKVMLPEIVPLLCLFFVMDMGNVLSSNFALFYQIPKDSSALYSVTDVLSTYVYRGMRLGNISTTAALDLVVAMVGVITYHTSNAIVRKISPENAMY